MVEFTIKPFLYSKKAEDDLQVYVTSSISRNLYSYFIIGKLQESLKINEKTDLKSGLSFHQNTIPLIVEIVQFSSQNYCITQIKEIRLLLVT